MRTEATAGGGPSRPPTGVDVWLFYPEPRAADTRATRLAIRALCKEREWGYQERPAKFQRLDSRPVHLVAPVDAHALYRRLHRVDVACLVMDSADVCIRPDVSGPSCLRHLRTMRQLTLHKSFYYRYVPGTIDPAAWVDGFESWRTQVGCDGDHDPRSLPLHVFAVASTEHIEWPATTKGRADFDGRYGAGARRTDSEDHLWVINRHDFHGREVLQIAGHRLQQGVHWDVQPVDGRPIKVHSLVELWETSSYLNVYPDSCFRGTGSSKRLIPRR